jgi:hypothetical protein
VACEAFLQITAGHAALWHPVEPIEDATLSFARTTRHNLTVLLARPRFARLVYGLNRETLVTEALFPVLHDLQRPAAEKF